MKCVPLTRIIDVNLLTTKLKEENEAEEEEEGEEEYVWEEEEKYIV